MYSTRAMRSKSCVCDDLLFDKKNAHFACSAHSFRHGSRFAVRGTLHHEGRGTMERFLCNPKSMHYLHQQIYFQQKNVCQKVTTNIQFVINAHPSQHSLPFRRNMATHETQQTHPQLNTISQQPQQTHPQLNTISQQQQDNLNPEKRAVLEDEPPKPPIRQRVRNWLEENRQSMKAGAVIATVLGGGGIKVIRSAPDVIDLLDALDIGLQYEELSYIVGAASSVVIMLLYRFTQRVLAFKPQELIDAAKKRALTDEIVKRHVGDDGAVGAFMSTVTLQAGPRWRKESDRAVYYGWERYWKPNGLVINFDVKGSLGRGVISCTIYRKLNGDIQTRTMTLTMLVPEMENTVSIISIPIEKDSEAKV